MVNRIIRNIEFPDHMDQQYDETVVRLKDFFTSENSKSFVELEGIRLYLNMSEEDFEEAR